MIDIVTKFACAQGEHLPPPQGARHNMVWYCPCGARFLCVSLKLRMGKPTARWIAYDPQ